MTLCYLLDTNICIYIAKRKPIHILKKFEQLEVGEVAMSIITYGELLYGVQKSAHLKKSQAVLQELISLIPPLPMSTEVAEYYADVRGKLEKQGKPIGNNDLWIAAHALALRLILVTNNTREFARVSYLKIENWAD